jgi:hypothetical protein
MTSIKRLERIMRGAKGRQDLAALGQMGSAGVCALARRLRALGPYLFIELLLPGGTLISLLLFLYRRGGAFEAAAGDAPVRPVIVVARIAAGLRSFWC